MSHPLMLLCRFLAAIVFIQRDALGWIGLQHFFRGPPLAARGRGMEYVETAEEQGLSLFWQNKRTFETTNRLVEAVLLPDAWNSSAPLLKQLDEKEETGNEYESLFSVLFEPQNERIKLERSNDASFPNKRKRSFRLELAYRGSDFCGWQRQPNNPLPSIQGTVEDWLSALQENQCLDVRVCGRTDAGVHALRQTCRFRTWQPFEASDVMKHMQQCRPGSLRCTDVKRVTNKFHPTFGATCRAYAYIIDLHSNSTLSESDIFVLNDLLESLQGLELDYYSMSYGKIQTQSTLCLLHYARASLVTHGDDNTRAVCIQLVANRFLRRMVRILVATALRETLNNEGEASRLLDIVQTRDRQASATAAPPHGLIFVGASFDERSESN